MKRLLALVGALVLWYSSTAWAAPITFVGTDGSRSAQVDFAVVGGQLEVTLTNTWAGDGTGGLGQFVPTDLLTAVFFDISGSPALTPVSAEITAPGAVLNAGSVDGTGGATDPDAGGVDNSAGSGVGGEWGYLGGLSGAPGGADYGISSTGLGLFGPTSLFSPCTVNKGTPQPPCLSGPQDPDGPQYGIIGAGYGAGEGNPAIESTPIIQDSVVFLLSDLPGGFDPSALITNVTFLYGTSLTDPQFPGVPEPASLLLLGSGLALAAKRARSKRRQNAPGL